MRNITPDDVKELDDKRVATSEKNGTYGGGNIDYAVLAYLLQCSIVKLDQKTPQECEVFVGNKKGSTKKYTAADLATFMRGAALNGEPVLVVEFNGAHGGQAGHFAAYQSLKEYMPEKLPWLTRALGKQHTR